VVSQRSLAHADDDDHDMALFVNDSYFNSRRSTAAGRGVGSALFIAS